MDAVTIPLENSELCAIVDQGDATTVRKYRWYLHRKGRNRYARTQLVRDDGSRHYLRMHVLIMGSTEGAEVDHKDRDGLNNRRDNLRIATRQQNRANSRNITNRKSPYRGIFWDNHRAKWKAEITVNGKRVRLGTYAHPADAARAYDRAAREAFGEFASLNFP